jgi:hypothetical protein
MANAYLAYQFSGPVVQAVVDQMLASIQAPESLMTYWAGLTIGTAQDVDGTLNFVGALCGYPRPLVSDVFFFTYMFLFTDAALPSAITFPYGFADAEYIANGDCESATNDPLMVTDAGTTAFKSNVTTYTRDGTHVHGGSFARKFVYGTTGSKGWADFTSMDTGLNGLSPGETYAFSLWLYIPSGQGGLTPSSMIRLVVDDGVGGSLSQYVANTVDAYQQVTVTGVLASGATKATPRVECQASTPTGVQFWIDDVAWSSTMGGQFDDANPPTTNIMPAAWYQSLLPLMAIAKFSGFGLAAVDALASWANTNGGGTGWTVRRDAYGNILVVFTTFIDPRALWVVNAIAQTLTTLPLVVFEEP